jgi:Kef-type K+ transport system membrane component KefB
VETFIEISVIIVIAAGVALIFQLLKQPLVLGHIITGILVGPAVLNIIRSEQTIQVFSHLGITSLLFIVGLSLSPRVMRDVGKVALAAGFGQIVFTTILGYAIGFFLGFSAIVSLFLAFAFTFSSTIIVSKILSDKGDSNKLYGRIAIGMLLVQDVVATIALIFIASTENGAGANGILAASALKIILIGGSLCLISAYVLPALTPVFARSQEFLFLFSIGWGVGMAALFHAFGLSVELGALAAGVTLASSPYHYEIGAKMKMIRDFFIVMFFVLLGSQLSASNLSEFLWPVVAYSIFIIIGNPLIVMAIMGVMGYGKKTGFRTGLVMAQISEFSLILIILGIQHDYVPSEYLSLATIVGIVTIAASTVMMLAADRIYAALSPLLWIFEHRRHIPERAERETYDVILFGCHRVGHDFLPTILKMRKPYLVVDFDPEIIRRLKERGIRARYGDAEDDAFLESLRLNRAKLVISTIPDYEPNEFLVNKIRKRNARAVVIAMAQRVKDAQKLYADGASYVIMPHHTGGNEAALLVDKHGHDKKKFDLEKARHLRHLRDRYKSERQEEPHYLKVAKERM